MSLKRKHVSSHYGRQNDKAASKRVCASLLTHKASESRFNEVKEPKTQMYVEH